MSAWFPIATEAAEMADRLGTILSFGNSLFIAFVIIARAAIVEIYEGRREVLYGPYLPGSGRNQIDRG